MSLSTTQSGQGRFLFFSDVHFDPFADPEIVARLAASDVSEWESIFASSSKTGYSAYGKDTNNALLLSALDDMAAAAKDVDFIIFPGDILSHDFNAAYAALTGDTSAEGLQSFIKKTADYFAAELSKRFPGTPVYFSLGNNDSDTGDYKIIPADPFLRDTAATFAATFLQDDADRTSFLSSYPLGGYYSVTLGDNGPRLIVLNDIFWSKDYADPGPGRAELAWFSSQLADAAANNEKVWVLTHIPLGADARTSISAFEKTGTADARSDLTEEFNNAFTALETTYADTIETTLAGHIHRDSFRLLTDPVSGLVEGQTRISLSISPIHANNPGYHIFTYDTQTWDLIDYETHTLDLASSAPSWSLEYDFAAAYGTDLTGPEQWAASALSILTDPLDRNGYAVRYAANLTALPAEITPENFNLYWLAAVCPYTSVYDAAWNGLRQASGAFDALTLT